MFVGMEGTLRCGRGTRSGAGHETHAGHGVGIGHGAAQPPDEVGAGVHRALD
jgi:hypothetical protein